MPPRAKHKPPDRSKQLEGLLVDLIAESDRTAAMTGDEFFKDVRARHPDVLFPSMIGKTFLSPVEDRILARWARLVRQLDPALMRTIGAKRWEQVVRARFVEVDQKARGPGGDRSAGAFGAKLLDSAKEQASRASIPLKHYCPCYLFKTTGAPAFQIGGIDFIPGGELCERIVATFGQEPQWLATFREIVAAGGVATPTSPARDYYTARSVWDMSQYPWVAVVRTAGYESTMAHRRANDVVRLAIAGIGLRAGPTHAGTVSLAQEWGRPAHLESMMQASEGDIAVGSETNFPQIRLDAAGLASFLKKHEEFFGWLGKVITAASASTQTSTNLQEFWLNALYWYHTGCLETSDARAIICFATALESLSSAEGVDSILEALEVLLPTDRMKLAVPSEQWTLEQTLDQVYSFGRSRTVHGSHFALFQEYGSLRSIASEITGFALIAFQRELCAYELRYRGKATDDKATFLRVLAGRR